MPKEKDNGYKQYVFFGEEREQKDLDLAEKEIVEDVIEEMIKKIEQDQKSENEKESNKILNIPISYTPGLLKRVPTKGFLSTVEKGSNEISAVEEDSDKSSEYKINEPEIPGTSIKVDFMRHPLIWLIGKAVDIMKGGF